MATTTEEFLKKVDILAEQRRQEILHTKDTVTVPGTAYYVSNAGDDENDGRTPATAWKTSTRCRAAQRSSPSRPS